MNEPEVIAESKVDTESQINILIDSSVMNTFEKCPTLMKYEHVDHYRFRGGKKPYFDKGELWHIGARAYYRMRKEEKEWDDCVKEGFERIMKVAPKFLSMTNEDLEDVITAFMAYCEHYRFERWTILEIERPFRVVLYEDDELRIIIQGRIDLIVDTGQIILPVDHKTESRRDEPGPLNNQFMLYCYAAKTNNLMVNKVGFQKSLPAQEKYYRVLLSYDDDNLAEWKDEFIFKVREIVEYARLDWFPHRYTSCKDKYGKCTFYEICKTPRIARQTKLDSQFEVSEPWDPFKDIENEEVKDEIPKP